MNLTFSEIVSPPAHLPVSATDEALAAAVTEEIERVVICGVPSSLQEQDAS